MVATESRSQYAPSSEPYRAALDAALSELARIRENLQVARHGIAELEVHEENLSAVIEKLTEVLPPAERALYRQRVEIGRPIKRSAHATPVYDNVVQLFGRTKRREWTAPEVQEALKADGVQTEPQQVHNVLGYLARKGLLRRISRGRYYVVEYGFGIEGDIEGGYDR
jgi:hypothetical protein